MTQDNPNDTVNAEEPQVVGVVPDGQTQAQPVEPAVDALAEKPRVGEETPEENARAEDERDDEMSDDESDAEEEAKDDQGHPSTRSGQALGDADTSDPISTSNASTTTQSPTAPSANSEDADERCEIEKQPYDFDHCTVQIAIQLLPDDQGHPSASSGQALGDSDPNGRMVVVGVRSHLDAPILRCVRLNELGALPPIVNALLDELKADLPTREQATRAAFEKKKEEKARRKSVVAASRTSSRGKKTKAPMSAAPASAATTDNRPRPEVIVPTKPQQQIGLF